MTIKDMISLCLINNIILLKKKPVRFYTNYLGKLAEHVAGVTWEIK